MAAARLGWGLADVQVDPKELPENQVLDCDGGQPRQQHEPANRVNDSPLAANAIRLVRLDTGNSSDAEFAR